MLTVLHDNAGMLVMAEISAGAGHAFGMRAVAAAMSGGVPHVGAGQYRRAALDISAGGDEQVLAVCNGNRAWIERPVIAILNEGTEPLGNG